MARLQDVTGCLDGEDKEIYERMVAKRKKRGAGLYGLYSVLMNHPVLAEHIEQLGYYYKFESQMPADVYQFVVLLCAKNRSDEFEWIDHVEHARESGVPEDIISAIDSGGAGAVPEPYRMVARVAECALRYESIPGELQEEAIERFGVKTLLEIVTVCGFYGLVTTVDRCFDVPLPGKAADQARLED